MGFTQRGRNKGQLGITHEAFRTEGQRLANTEKKVYSYVILPIMHRPRFALVIATLIWCSSVTNPSF